jgi:predicted helicase
VRQTRTEAWGHALVSDSPAPAIYVEVKDGSTIFPLYLYLSASKSNLFDDTTPSSASGGRRPNLDPAFIKDFSSRLKLEFIPDGKGDLKKTFGPEDIFDYMYAVFHSPTYRSRYAEFLKIDFPRLPLTSDLKLFRELCALGGELVGLHLMEKVPKSPVKLKGHGVSEVATGHPKFEEGRVSINPSQYFEPVPDEVWNFHIGGYQVCHKWLKDRRGRVLTDEDIEHYKKIVVALGETIRLMGEIDEVIDSHGGWPGAFVTE